ncbi:hypothetical protein [Prosthecobacter sp.]|uniref:hypothetical protein n=1 Tax=Prosthecobacter sp. TaxID=1965333 RepID=UPI003784DFCC
MPASKTSSSKSPWWLESLLGSLVIIAAVGIAAYVNETAREIVAQGLAYLFTFFSTPFVLETSTAFLGLCIVMFINNRRLEREGDGWVEMEITEPDAAESSAAGQTSAEKASEA